MRTRTGDEAETQPEEAPAEAPPSRRLPVLCAVAGFVVGSCVIGLLWGLSNVHAGALEDAKAACEALDRVGALPDTSHSSTPSPPVTLSAERLHRMTAARELSAAAAAVNPAYEDLAAQIDGVSRMVFSLHFNDISGQRHLTQAQELCARV